MIYMQNEKIEKKPLWLHVKQKVVLRIQLKRNLPELASFLQVFLADL